METRYDASDAVMRLLEGSREESRTDRFAAGLVAIMCLALIVSLLVAMSLLLGAA